MITDTANALALLCGELQTGIRGEQEMNAVSKSVERLRAVAQKISTSKQVAASLPSPVVLEGDIAKRKSSLSRLQKSLAKEEPDVLIKSQKFETAIRHAESLGQEAEKSATAAWERHLATVLPADLAEAITFPDLPGLHQASASFQAATSRLRVAEKSSPLDVLKKEGKAPTVQLEEIEMNNQKRAAALATLDEATLKFPPTVRQFIEAAGSEAGASLELMTNELLAWLFDNDQLALYRVKPDVS
jgi:hypothetical protein